MGWASVGSEGDVSTLIDKVAQNKLRRYGFWSLRIPGALGVHHVYDGPGEGDLPPVVLLHGFGSGSTHMVRLIGLLRPHVRRIIVPDLLGHGQSDAAPEDASNRAVSQALFDVLEELLDEPALVFGNSLGGMMGLRFAVDRPRSVKGLVVCSPAGAPLNPHLHAEMLRRFRPQNVEEARVLVDLAFAGKAPLPKLAARNLHQRLMRPSVQRLLDNLLPSDLFTPEELSRLAAPGQLLWGASERLLFPEQLAFFQAHLPTHCPVLRPEGYGHVAYFENAVDLAARIVAFGRALHARAAA